MGVQEQIADHERRITALEEHRRRTARGGLLEGARQRVIEAARGIVNGRDVEAHFELKSPGVLALYSAVEELEAAESRHLGQRVSSAVAESAALSDLLSLVGVEVEERRVRGWTDDQREEVRLWASTVHVAASDHDVVVPHRPAFLPPRAAGGE